MNNPRISIGRSPITHIILILVLILLVGIGTFPGYLKGKWSWREIPQVQNLNQIRNLRETGLVIPGWQTIKEGKTRMGGKKWWAQILKKEGQKPVKLLLLPQHDAKAHPEVEWMDINGEEKWQTDGYEKLKFTYEKEGKSLEVEARFFRAWTERRTFAVLQWYAVPDGAYTAPAQWFWADQKAQLDGDRVPWVAVSLHIPIEPLGEKSTARPLAESLGKIVQSNLEANVFSP